MFGAALMIPRYVLMGEPLGWVNPQARFHRMGRKFSESQCHRCEVPNKTHWFSDEKRGVSPDLCQAKGWGGDGWCIQVQKSIHFLWSPTG